MRDHLLASCQDDRDALGNAFLHSSRHLLWHPHTAIVKPVQLKHVSCLLNIVDYGESGTEPDGLDPLIEAVLSQNGNVEGTYLTLTTVLLLWWLKTELIVAIL